MITRWWPVSKWVIGRLFFSFSIPAASILAASVLAALAACKPRTLYRPPTLTDDGWSIASVQEARMDETQLQDMLQHLQNDPQDVHSVIIVRQGKLVLEAYFPGYAWSYDPQHNYQGQHIRYDADTLHNLASITKAVTSALVGIALDRGLISGVDTPIIEFFPQYAHLFDEDKGQITLRHLLTMSSGLQWNEGQYGYGDSRNDLIRLFRETDPIAFILSRPLVHQPGSTYYYSGGDVNLLGEIIRQVSGQRMDEFAQTHLFVPLGINHYQWDFINADVVHASGNLQLRPRDVAKFGELYLRGGLWQDRQLISSAWVAESTQGHIDMPGGPADDRYGYQWHIRSYQVKGQTIPSFCKEGWGGQRVTVFPTLDMVVVFTGGSYTSSDPIDELTIRYILPAAQ